METQLSRQARVLHFLALRGGAEPIRLPGRDEQMLLPVVVSGFGQQPLMLLANVSAERDSSTLWSIV